MQRKLVFLGGKKGLFVLLILSCTMDVDKICLAGIFSSFPFFRPPLSSSWGYFIFPSYYCTLLKQLQSQTRTHTVPKVSFLSENSTLLKHDQCKAIWGHWGHQRPLRPLNVTEKSFWTKNLILAQCVEHRGWPSPTPTQF